MSGRKPTPSHLKIVKGNPGKRPLPQNEPKPERGAPPAPDHLSAQAKDVWAAIAPQLERAGVLTLVDVLALEMLCEAYRDYQDARGELEDFGSNYYETMNQAGGVMRRTHPAVAAMRDADRRIKAWLAEFGMTPSARTRVDAAPKGDGRKDPAEDYFRSGH